MKRTLSRKVAEMAPSGIRAFFDLVAGRDDIVSLGVGEPDFVTPWNVREAGIFSLEKGYTSYTSNRGMPELRKSISSYQQKLIGVDYHPDKDILVTVGVSQGLDITLRALLDPGDEVLYFEPCYVSYRPMIELAGGVPVLVELAGETFSFDPEAVRRAITPRTKAILICSPNNPTGSIALPEQLVELAAICREQDLIAISDEIYAELTYDSRHRSIVSEEGMRQRTIVLNGLSKSQSMTGWRIGYACGPADLIEGMLKIHQYSMLCAPITAQMAAKEALDNGATVAENILREYQRRRRYIVDCLCNMGLECHAPGGAFYAFPSIRSTGLDSITFCSRLLEEGKVAVVPGSAFGRRGEGYVRCAYASSLDDIRTAMERMQAFVKASQACRVG